MFGEDHAYWQRRAQQERERAVRSEPLAVREAHRELAAAYEARLKGSREDERAVG